MFPNGTASHLLIRLSTIQGLMSASAPLLPMPCSLLPARQSPNTLPPLQPMPPQPFRCSLLPLFLASALPHTSLIQLPHLYPKELILLQAVLPSTESVPEQVR